LISNESEPKRIAAQVGLPFAVKPVHEGSSIGITKVTRVEELRAAWAAARELDDLVIAERWVDGEEYTGGVLGERVLPLIRLETPREFYDYQAKYLADTTRYHCPCGLPVAREEELRALCWQAFAAIGASGWGRVDFMLDSAGQPWLLEVNTVPGMTDHSLVPMAARAAGIDFDELVLCILDTSFARSAGVAREVA
jgi:D-alanine-D-alanine ligase